MSYQDKLNLLIENIYEGKIKPEKEFTQYHGFLNHEVAYFLGEFVAKKLVAEPEKLKDITSQYLQSLSAFNLQNITDSHLAFFRVLEKNANHHPFMKNGLVNTQATQEFIHTLVHDATKENDYHSKYLTEQLTSWMNQSMVENVGKKTKLHSLIYETQTPLFPLYQTMREYLDNTENEKHKKLLDKIQTKQSDDVVYVLAVISALKIANQEDMTKVAKNFALTLKEYAKDEDSIDNGLTNLAVYLKVYAKELVDSPEGFKIDNKTSYTHLALKADVIQALATTIYDTLYEDGHTHSFKQNTMPHFLNNFIQESVNSSYHKVKVIKESIDSYYENQNNEALIHKIKDKRKDSTSVSHLNLAQNKNSI